ncbi:GNAT family N-acetyltransferase [Aquiflexum sp.]|uniref:GNAT family N-acetyltransferase n=1 Tax=Aquiflexum sp. TaxID=1872584 RepID=UPI0035948B95
MDSLSFQTAKTTEDLQGILDLQQQNHLSTIRAIENGFVFVRHDLTKLAKMQSFAPQVICKEDGKVVAFTLAMTTDCKGDIPELIPMFDVFDKLNLWGKKVSEFNYIVVGQVCVGEKYRGMGVFDKIYDTYRETFKDKFDFAITEISTRNPRSIRAHSRIGFEEIHQFTDPSGENWSIVAWDWGK